MTIINPLFPPSQSSQLGAGSEVSLSMDHDRVDVCPKCRMPFGSGVVGGKPVYFCEKCCVTQPVVCNQTGE